MRIEDFPHSLFRVTQTTMLPSHFPDHYINQAHSFIQEKAPQHKTFKWIIRTAMAGILMSSMTLGIADAAVADEELQLQQDSRYFKAFIPQGFKLFSTTRGDLNQDGIPDAVLVLKATDPKAWVTENDRSYDRNRRGMVVLMGTPKTHQYKTLVKNLSCFSSDQEDGGVYFPPELLVHIQKGILVLNYAHGRYGYRAYKFRSEQQDLRLIGYDQSDNFGPMVLSITSINFLTGKKLVKDNLNRYESDLPERFKDTWTTIQSAPLYLSQVHDFDELLF